MTMMTEDSSEQSDSQSDRFTRKRRRRYDNEDSDEASSPKSPKERYINQQNEVAGKVEKIVLKNFMCHSNLEVGLTPHVNYICGKNGSGKSAVLTGLVVGLGGRSSTTNRGNSFKDLIKKGLSFGQTEITLSNGGYRGYKPEVYGQSITVVRSLSNATSKYKLLSTSGKVISTSKSELDRILRSHNIQINNPISVLNQDLARTFLHSTNPKSMYQFFMASTLLSDIDANIKELKQNELPPLMNQLDRKRKDLEICLREVAEAKRKIEAKKKYVALENDVVEMENELNWSKVLECRETLNKIQKEVSLVDGRAEQYRQSLKNPERVEAGLKSKIDENLTKLNELKSKKEKLLDKNSELEEKYRSLMTRLNKNDGEKKVLESKLSREQSAKEKIEQELANYAKMNEQAFQKRTEQAKQKAVLEERMKSLQCIIDTSENHNKNLAEDLKKKNHETVSAESALRQCRIAIDKCNQRLQQFKHTSELSVFANWMPRLVQLIDIAFMKRQFDRKPVGPLGKHIRLKDKDWGPAIEATLNKNLLRSFRVHSEKDFRLLKTLFQQVGVGERMPSVIISPFSDQVYDVSQHEAVHDHYPTLLKMLEIDNAIVTNTLLDQVGVESILLVPSTKDAYRLMSQQDNVPPRCKQCITKGYSFYPTPRYRSYPLMVTENTCILQADKSLLIRQTEEELLKSKVEEKEAMVVFNRKREAEETAKVEMVRANKDLNRVVREVAAIKDKLARLQNDEEPVELNENVFLEDLEFRKRNIASISETLKKLKSEYDTLEREFGIAKAAMGSHPNADDGLDEEISLLKVNLSEAETELREFSANQAEMKRKLSKEEVRLVKLRDEEERMMKEKEKRLRAAEESGREPRQCRRKTELEDRIGAIRSEMKVIIDLVGDLKMSEMTEEQNRRVESVTQAKSMIDSLTQGAKVCQKRCKKLEKEFDSVLLSLSANIKKNFDVFMRLRNLKGKMEINHKEKHLTLYLLRDDQSEEKTSVMCLSGGERSFSMMAFVLSLWKEAKSPFYFLDEFDVFMDPLSRKVVINLLNLHAKSRQEEQYVFLTPYDTDLKNSMEVGIFKMEDPRKN